MNNSLLEIANLVQGIVIGDAQITVSSLSPIDDIIPGTLVFADGKDNIQIAESSDAAALLVNASVTHTTKPLIQVAHPLKAFIKLLHHFNPPTPAHQGIHPSAAIADDVQLGQNVSVGPFVVIESGSRIGNNVVLKSHVHIGHDVTIGDHTIIHPQVTVYDHCRIGSRVSIHASAVIGSDGFGYSFIDGQHLKIPHIGHVVIEDDVEIGANTAIDRATVGTTYIGRGTKIDNLVQIAHSVKLGQNNILCAFTGIAGSTTTGNNVIFAANVGVSDHVRIDDGVILGARTGVPPHKHLKSGNVYLGSPARPKDKALENELSVTRIPFMRKHIKSLGEQIKAINKKLAEQEAES
jgi:UDP-3-O-[3-hydroxymyristoyl] glucosamine N-acyltransferase